MHPEPVEISVRHLVGHWIQARPYLTHSWDRYPAKMVPHMARYALQRVSVPGDTVLDPFCGCGTVQVESLAMGRNAVGYDVNPLAVLYAKAKTRPLDEVRVKELAASVTDRAAKRPIDSEYPRWLTYWFTEATLRKLGRLRTSILGLDVRRSERDVLFAALARSVRGCSRADPRSPKPFISETARERRRGVHFDPYEIFIEAIESLAIRSRALFSTYGASLTRSVTRLRDSRDLNKATRMRVDAIVTSPPYLTAQDYFRSSKLELAILNLNPEVSMSRESAWKIIGSGRGIRALGKGNSDDIHLRGFQELLATSARDGSMAASYIADMQLVLRGCRRVVRDGGQCCFVVGDCQMRGVCLPIHEWFIEIAEGVGFRLVRHESDTIRDRRIPPKRQGHPSVIEREHLLYFV